MARWTWVVLFTSFIYATLPFGRQVWGQFTAASRFWSDNVAVVGLLLVGAGAVWFGVRRAELPARAWLSGAAVALAYVACLRLIPLTPAEKTHFLYYGFLGFLVQRALRQHTAGGVLFAGTIAIVAIIGLGDELIQHALPRRFFEWKDVWLNALSGALAVVLVGALTRPDRDASEA